jgi:hypothetical protein
MPLWEYSLVYGLTDGKGQERDFLDRWGSEGWELILIVPAGYRRYPDERPSFSNPEYSFYYFKRPRSRSGIVGRLLDTLSATLVWGRSRSLNAMPEIMPGLERPASPTGNG